MYQQCVPNIQLLIITYSPLLEPQQLISWHNQYIKCKGTEMTCESKSFIGTLPIHRFTIDFFFVPQQSPSTSTCRIEITSTSETLHKLLVIISSINSNIISYTFPMKSFAHKANLATFIQRSQLLSPHVHSGKTHTSCWQIQL